RTNRVDHIVMGARANSALRTFLGSVSQEVVAKAPCTVTVVRLPRPLDPDAEGSSRTA
ncbi:MAG TPA: universal stress protein, partial [Thermoanaerobaculia bacterium]